MKYLILLNLCLLSYVGCANKHNRQNDTTNKIQSLSDSCKLLGKDPLSNYCSAIDTNVIHEQEYVIDTVAGDFYIYCRTEDNQNIVSTTHYKYADRSSVLTVSRNNGKLVSRLEIDKYDFDSLIPATEIDRYQLYNVHIRDYDDRRVVLSFGIYQPDTDIGYPVLLTIYSLGKLSAEIEHEIWEDDF